LIVAHNMLWFGQPRGTYVVKILWGVRLWRAIANWWVKMMNLRQIYLLSNFNVLVLILSAARVEGGRNTYAGFFHRAENTRRDDSIISGTDEFHEYSINFWGRNHKIQKGWSVRSNLGVFLGNSWAPIGAQAFMSL